MHSIIFSSPVSSIASEDDEGIASCAKRSINHERTQKAEINHCNRIQVDVAMTFLFCNIYRIEPHHRLCSHSWCHRCRLCQESSPLQEQWCWIFPCYLQKNKSKSHSPVELATQDLPLWHWTMGKIKKYMDKEWRCTSSPVAGHPEGTCLVWCVEGLGLRRGSTWCHFDTEPVWSTCSPPHTTHTEGCAQKNSWRSLCWRNTPQVET